MKAINRDNVWLLEVFIVIGFVCVVAAWMIKAPCTVVITQGDPPVIVLRNNTFTTQVYVVKSNNKTMKHLGLLAYSMAATSSFNFHRGVTCVW